MIQMWKAISMTGSDINDIFKPKIVAVVDDHRQTTTSSKSKLF